MRKARWLLAAGLACLTVSALPVPSAQASTPIDKELNFSCPFPLIGRQKLDVEVKASFEVPSAPGGTFTTSDLSVAVSVPDKSARGLALVGAASIEGTASAGVTLTDGSLTLPLNLPLTVAKTPVPPSGTFTTQASGSVPPVQGLRDRARDGPPAVQPGRACRPANSPAAGSSRTRTSRWRYRR
ncbi:hypothetical protein OG738_19985 [Amycolatopsis sp. NBC_01488]|uniref:DUF6801 domain-containing protein n=1 Tax=Amycolatopsis sp. NBC_01488 TaxID=2903563 RepID=UPI002E2D7197|nr:DUF6801 domain-containing protein [Amycolatopsis sp. NBC_01488]